MNLLTDLGSDNQAMQMWLKFQARRRGCQLLCGPYAWDLTKDSRVIRIDRQHFASVVRLASDFDELFSALLATQAGSKALLDFSRLHLHTYREAGLQFEMPHWPEPDAPIDAYLEFYQPTGEELMFDLGAEYGVSTYSLSKICKTVVAFEQQAHLRNVIERNVLRHGLTNVVVAKPSAASFADLILLHGQPAFCRINLDKIAPAFLLSHAQAWTRQSITLAARSNSKAVRRRFTSFLKDSGFSISLDPELGMIWADQGTMWHALE